MSTKIKRIIGKIMIRGWLHRWISNSKAFEKPTPKSENLSVLSEDLYKVPDKKEEPHSEQGMFNPRTLLKGNIEVFKRIPEFAEKAQNGVNKFQDKVVKVQEAVQDAADGVSEIGSDMADELDAMREDFDGELEEPNGKEKHE